MNGLAARLLSELFAGWFPAGFRC